MKGVYLCGVLCALAVFGLFYVCDQLSDGRDGQASGVGQVQAATVPAPAMWQTQIVDGYIVAIPFLVEDLGTFLHVSGWKLMSPEHALAMSSAGRLKLGTIACANELDPTRSLPAFWDEYGAIRRPPSGTVVYGVFWLKGPKE